MINCVRSALVALGLTSSLAVNAAESGTDTVEAVWMPQKIDFYYQSFTTFFSCDALESRVLRLMKAVGAREDTKVRVSGCESINGPSRMPHVRIELIAPVEATPAALAELKKDETQRELRARVRGERAEELTAQFPAQWRKVNLSRGNLDIDPGECELIDELKDKVFAKMAIRVTLDEVSCTPHQRTIGQPRLQVEALTAVPDPDQAKG